MRLLAALLVASTASAQDLTSLIWRDGLPSAPPSVASDVPLPIRANDVDPANVGRVDRLDVLTWDYRSSVFLLHPVVRTSPWAVIVHQGHDRTLRFGRVGMVANRLLSEGHTVVLMHMPLRGWNYQRTVTVPGLGAFRLDSHDAIIQSLGMQGFRLFLQPVIVAVNHLEAQGFSVAMTGLSGGGWTTSMAAAIDPRITVSMPVAGSAPLEHRATAVRDAGDLEQHYLPLYSFIPWKRIYAMGAGPGRRQLFVTNEYDPCCFSGRFADRFSAEVSAETGGQWVHVLDSTHADHQISPFAEEILLRALSSHPPSEARSPALARTGSSTHRR